MQARCILGDGRPPAEAGLPEFSTAAELRAWRARRRAEGDG